jgi:hypothetical protein
LLLLLVSKGDDKDQNTRCSTAFSALVCGDM